MADPYGGVQWQDWTGNLKYISNAVTGGASGWSDGLNIVGPANQPAYNPYADSAQEANPYIDVYAGQQQAGVSNAVMSLDRTTVADALAKQPGLVKTADLGITGFAQLNPSLWALRTNTGVRYATNLAGHNADGMEWNPRIASGTEVGYIGIDNPMGINASKLALLPENYDLSKLSLQGHKPGSEDKAWMEDMMGFAILGSALFAMAGGAMGLFGSAAAQSTSQVSLTAGLLGGGEGLKFAGLSQLTSLADLAAGGLAGGTGMGLHAAVAPGLSSLGGATGITLATAAGTISAGGLYPVGSMATIGSPASFVNTGGVFPYVPDINSWNALIGDYQFGNIGLNPNAQGAVGLRPSAIPNLPGMNGQGITGYSPSQAGTITEGGFIPDGTVPSLGDPDSFINKGFQQNKPGLWDGFSNAIKAISGLPMPGPEVPALVIPGVFSGVPTDAPPDAGKVTDVMGGLPWNASNQRGLGLRSRNPYKSGLAF